MSQGGAEATRGAAGGGQAYELESAKGDQGRRQKANENARQGKPLRLAFCGKMPEALLRASTCQKNSTVEGFSLKGCIDQLFPFAKPDPFPRLP